MSVAHWAISLSLCEKCLYQSEAHFCTSNPSQVPQPINYCQLGYLTNQTYDRHHTSSAMRLIPFKWGIYKLLPPSFPKWIYRILALFLIHFRNAVLEYVLNSWSIICKDSLVVELNSIWWRALLTLLNQFQNKPDNCWLSD